MTEKLNNFLFAKPAVVTAVSQQSLWKRMRCFVMPDLVLLPALGFFWVVVLWSMFNTFITTFMPSPCLPTVISTVINVSKVSKGYLGVAQALWSCSSETYYMNSLSVSEVVPKLEQNYASV